MIKALVLKVIHDSHEDNKEIKAHIINLDITINCSNYLIYRERPS